MKNLLWTALLLTACGGGASGPSVDQLDKAKEEARAFRPWAEFSGSVEGLGEAKVDGEFHSWAAKDGDKCKILKVQKVGDAVGNATIEEGACP